jgi:hypothetical protein
MPELINGTYVSLIMMFLIKFDDPKARRQFNSATIVPHQDKNVESVMVYITAAIRHA